MKTKFSAIIFLFFLHVIIYSQNEEWTIYNTSNTPQTGPCNSEIYGITQDKDSNLWFATSNGISKFDGQNWISFFSENDNGQDNFYYSIAINSENKVYLGLNGFATINNAVIEIIDYMLIFDMDIDSNDNVWLATIEGLKKYDGSAFIDISAGHEMLTEFTGAVEVDRNNHIWAGTYNGVLYFNDTLWQHFTTEDGLLDNFVFYIEADSENNIWMMNSLGFSKFDGQNFTNFPLPDSINEAIFYGMTIAYDNMLYIATENYGILQFNGSDFSFFNMSDGLKSNRVLSCFEDMEKNLWIGYYGYGTDKYNGSEFTSFTGNGINSIEVLRYYDNKLWIGSMNGGLTIFNGATWENHNISNGFLSNIIKDMDMDSQGNIWLSTKDGIVNYNGSDFTNYTESEGLPENLTLAIFVDNNDHTWVGTVHNGAAMYDGQNWTYYNSSNSLIGERVDAIFQDDNNTMWFGSSNNEGLYDGFILNYKGETWNSFQPIEGIVKDILQDSKGNIWFGYVFSKSDYTIAMYGNEEWDIFKLPYNDDILHVQTIYDIFEDKDSLLWFGRALFGSTTFDGENWVNYTLEDGYPHTTNRAITQDAEGNMWIGSYLKGLYKHNVGTNIVEPVNNKGFNDFTVFPNPASDIISIKSAKEYISLKKAQLYNTEGKLLLEKEFHFDMIFDIQDLKSGVYIIKISNKFYNYSEKIIKK